MIVLGSRYKKDKECVRREMDSMSQTITYHSRRLNRIEELLIKLLDKLDLDIEEVKAETIISKKRRAPK